jgi:predicted TIM-barrel fold metal-dependent hydrolase
LSRQPASLSLGRPPSAATVHRRTLLGSVLAGASVASWGSAGEATVAVADAPGTSATVGQRPWKIIDTNVHLFQWPCRRLPEDTVERLVDKLEKLDISQAWAGSFEGLLHRDVTGVNDRVAEACQRHGRGRLSPVGTIHPGLPDWEGDLRRCQQVHRMRVIRLYPNYHEYRLDDPRLGELLQRCAEAGVLVQLCVSLEDPRTQHPRLQAADVDLEPLPSMMQAHPRAKVMLLNYKPTAGGLKTLPTVPNLFVDTARVEGSDGYAQWLRTWPPSRVVFGSHAPFLIYESALIKAYEAELTDDELLALFQDNALGLLGDLGPGNEVGYQ